MRQSTSLRVSVGVAGLVSVVLTLACANRVHAQDATTASAGGDGGNPFTVSCGTKVMVGVQGRSGSHLPLGVYVNVVQPLCVAVTADGSWIGTPTPSPTMAGVNTGDFASLMCPDHAAVSGISGRAAAYLDRLQIQCSFIGEYGTLANSAPTDGGWIGSTLFTGGNPFGPFSCTGGKPGKALTGKAQDWVDRVALVCGTPAVPVAVISSLDLNAQSVIGGNPLSGSASISAAAPAGGTTIGISRQVNVADVNRIPANPIPVEPVVPAGQYRATFTFNTDPVPTPVAVTLNAVAQGSLGAMATRTFSINPPSLVSMGASALKVVSGGSTTGTITMNGKAPAGGVSFSLASSIATAASVPPSAVIPQGQLSTTFPITASAGSHTSCSIISVSGGFAAPGTTPTRQALLYVSVPGSTAFRLDMPATAPQSATLTMTFATLEKVSRTVALTSSNPSLVSVPASVTVPANAATATFTMSTPGVVPAGLSCAAITAVVTTLGRDDANTQVVTIDATGIRRVN